VLADLRVKAKAWRGRWFFLQYTTLAWSRRGFHYRHRGHSLSYEIAACAAASFFTISRRCEREGPSEVCASIASSVFLRVFTWPSTPFSPCLWGGLRGFRRIMGKRHSFPLEQIVRSPYLLPGSTHGR
jgi:hypothetical protein